MSLEFTKLSEVAVAESISENASVLVEDGGEVKRVAKSKVCGGGGASSWNDLTDKPFYDLPTGGNTLFWDGNMEGLEELYPESGMYRICDSAPTYEELQNGFSGVIRCGDYLQQSNPQTSIIIEHDESTGMAIVSLGFIGLYCIPNDVEVEGTVVKKGVYTAVAEEDGMHCYIYAFTVTEYAGFPIPKPLSIKYMDTGYINGLIKKHFDETTVVLEQRDKYLYRPNTDTTDVADRLTMEELKAYVDERKRVYIYYGGGTYTATAVIPNTNNGYGTVHCVMAGGYSVFYTAEYVPETT